MKRMMGLTLAGLTAVALTAPWGAGQAHAVRYRGLFYSTVTFDSATSFDTNGAVTFSHPSTGRYSLFAPGVHGGGNAQLSVWDTDPADLPICTVSSVSQLRLGTRVNVRCFSSVSGAAADAVFSLFYSSYHVFDPTVHHVQLSTTSGGTVPSNQFRASGTGGASVRRLSTGRYRVRIPNETFAANGGIVMTTATGPFARWCNPTSWGPNGTGTEIFVECHKRGGALASSTFSLIATDNTMLGRPAIPGGSAWSNAAARTSAHTPLSFYSFNSEASTNTHADQILTGSAEVTFPDAFPPQSAVVAKLVTAYGPHRCAHQGLHGLNGSDVTLAVACSTATNVPVDSSFDVMLELLMGS